jgi:hypothetical protein
VHSLPKFRKAGMKALPHVSRNSFVEKTSGAWPQMIHTQPTTERKVQ